MNIFGVKIGCPQCARELELKHSVIHGDYSHCRVCNVNYISPASINKESQ